MGRMVTTLLVLAIVLAGAGCRSTYNKSFGQWMDDKMTTARVKSKLTADRVGNFTKIGVKTNNGVVYLTGNVDDPDRKAAAEYLARRVAGVRDVVDNIRVFDARAASRPAMRGAPPPAASPTTGPAAAAAAPGFIAQQTMAGEVTRIDRDSGRITLKTEDGDFDVRVPPAQIQNIKEGDRVNVEVGVRARR